jgi:putative endonuclease
MAFMYILECADGSYYVGSTRKLRERLWKHENGLGANHTRKRLPVRLVYVEEYDRVTDAFVREKQIQGWIRAKKKALIEGEYDRLPVLAKKVFGKGELEAMANTQPAANAQPAAVATGH